MLIERRVAIGERDWSGSSAWPIAADVQRPYSNITNKDRPAKHILSSGFTRRLQASLFILSSPTKEHVHAPTAVSGATARICNQIMTTGRQDGSGLQTRQQHH